MSYIGCIVKVAKRNVMSNIGRDVISYCRIYIAAVVRIKMQHIKYY